MSHKLSFEQEHYIRLLRIATTARNFHDFIHANTPNGTNHPDDYPIRLCADPDYIKPMIDKLNALHEALQWEDQLYSEIECVMNEPNESRRKLH